MQILPDLYQVNGQPYGERQNGFILCTPQVTVMIDSGDLENDTYPLVRRAAAAWGLALEQVDYLLLTHAHYDHASHAARIQRLGAKLVGNQACDDALRAADDRCLGFLVHHPFQPCALDRIVADNETLTLGDLTITCLAAPGHTESCVVYDVELSGERLRFVGDVFKVGPMCQSIEPGWAGSPDYDKAAYLRTLRRLAHIPCDHLLPGHGAPGLGQGTRLCEMAYTYAMLNWR